VSSLKLAYKALRETLRVTGGVVIVPRTTISLFISALKKIATKIKKNKSPNLKSKVESSIIFLEFRKKNLIVLCFVMITEMFVWLRNALGNASLKDTLKCRVLSVESCLCFFSFQQIDQRTAASKPFDL
jgi:hypothetical protein